MYEVPFDFPVLGPDEAVAAAHDTGFCGNAGDPLLECVVDILDELGRPDACFEVIQVAGTNGKTSTSRYTAAILAGEGLSVALYTSPELIEMRERMEVGGSPVSPGEFSLGVSAAAQAGRRVNARRASAGLPPYRVTAFDLLTAAALVAFARAGVDVAVLEVGLGGRWDATSATHPACTCVTGIGLDHTRILGDTLEQIAGEKAAVIKRGQRGCVLGVGCATPSSVEDVLLARCSEQGVAPVLVRPLEPADAPGEMEPGEMAAREGLSRARYHVTRHPERLGAGLVLDVTTPLGTYTDLCAARPVYQAANIACAVTLCELYLGRPLDQYHLSEHVGEFPTPCRFNVLSGSPLHLIDAAHNPQSVRTFLDSVREIEPDVSRRPRLLCAVLRDKDVRGIVDLLAGEFPEVDVCATSSPRALAPEELAGEFRRAGVDVRGTYPCVDDACRARARDSYVAVGSITLAGEVAAWHRARGA